MSFLLSSSAMKLDQSDGRGTFLTFGSSSFFDGLASMTIKCYINPNDGSPHLVRSIVKCSYIVFKSFGIWVFGKSPQQRLSINQ